MQDFKHKFHISILDNLSKIDSVSRYCAMSKLNSNPDDSLALDVIKTLDENEDISMIVVLDDQFVGIVEKRARFCLLNEKGLAFAVENNALHFKAERHIPIQHKVEGEHFIYGDLMSESYPDWRDKGLEYGSLKSFFTEYHGEETFKDFMKKGYATLPISFIRTNFNNALEYLNIDPDFFEQFKYECPFIRGNTFYGVVPVLAFIEPKKVKDVFEVLGTKLGFFERDMATESNIKDSFFESTVKPDVLINNPKHVYRIGHGYTDCTLPSDGSTDKQLMLLSYGDLQLLVEVRVWFNQ